MQIGLDFISSKKKKRELLSRIEHQSRSSAIFWKYILISIFFLNCGRQKHYRIKYTCCNRRIHTLKKYAIIGRAAHWINNQFQQSIPICYAASFMYTKTNSNYHLVMRSFSKLYCANIYFQQKKNFISCAFLYRLKLQMLCRLKNVSYISAASIRQSFRQKKIHIFSGNGQSS